MYLAFLSLPFAGLRIQCFGMGCLFRAVVTTADNPQNLRCHRYREPAQYLRKIPHPQTAPLHPKNRQGLPWALVSPVEAATHRPTEEHPSRPRHPRQPLGTSNH